jgi:predicted DCC family thiol-disulfide oxidoreductase YuxK
MGIELDNLCRSPAIVYDGDCPFCARYVRLLRLADVIGRVDLVNARDGGALVDYIRSRGLLLDEGMVFVLDGQLYHGSDCIQRLAMLTTPSNLLNRLNIALFRSKTVAKMLYPLLRVCRLAVLAAIGRSRLK